MSVKNSTSSKRYAKPTQEENRLLRRMQILKLLQEKAMRTGEIAEYFNVDDRTIRSDLEALRDGADFFGVKVKIESKHQGNHKHYYISTVHPVFLALNLSETLALLNLLEEASDARFSGEVYNSLFIKIYSQLTDYARRCIQDRLKKEHDTDIIKNLLEEDAVKKSEHYAIAYLFKSGKSISVTFIDNGEIIHNVKIIDIRADELTLRSADGAEYCVKYADVIIPWHNIDYT